ncbi:MAG TPA: thioredoxin [Candidatus Solibacter sp.]|nr:thioredoxin [Candidatus Solibacter sp.]
MADSLGHVNDTNFASDVIEASKSQPVLVDFWAEWCRPCLMLGPTVAEVAQENAGKIKVLKMNVDESPDTPSKYNIRGIPTLLLFKGGEVVGQLVGNLPKEEVAKFVSSHV